MDIKVRPEDLDEAVKAALEDWSDYVVHRAVNAAIAETAKETAKLLRKGGPYTDRPGRRYSRDWSYKKRARSFDPFLMTEEYTVYNKDNYRLTHLLENGHKVYHGTKLVGKARAFKHIAPAADFARDYLASAIDRKMREMDK